MELDYKTKCRCLFVLTLSIYEEQAITIDNDFFNLLHSYARDKIFENKKNMDKLYKIIYFKKTSEYTYSAYESVKTMSDLTTMLNKINNMNNLKKLYDEIDQKDIDLITDLAMDFITYYDNFNLMSYDNYRH